MTKIQSLDHLPTRSVEKVTREYDLFHGSYAFLGHETIVLDVEDKVRYEA